MGGSGENHSLPEPLFLKIFLVTTICKHITKEGADHPIWKARSESKPPYRK